jgi:hypothetical protein
MNFDLEVLMGAPNGVALRLPQIQLLEDPCRIRVNGGVHKISPLTRW